MNGNILKKAPKTDQAFLALLCSHRHQHICCIYLLDSIDHSDFSVYFQKIVNVNEHCF